MRRDYADMKDSKSRFPVAVCGTILAATATVKAVAIFAGTKLLSQSHPFLPGTYYSLVLTGLFVELIALVTLPLFGRATFLRTAMGLGVVFVVYHAAQKWLGIPAPCPCLGGIISTDRGLINLESFISLSLALLLCAVAFFGLVSPKDPSDDHDFSSGGSATVSGVVLWMMCGFAVILLWHNRTLGGDEGMEGSKAMYVLEHPYAIGRLWNDQPPLYSHLLAGLFRVTGVSFDAGRTGSVLIGLLLPLTWIAYLRRYSIEWAGVVAVGVLWLFMPEVLGSMMLEAPAYALGTAAALPLAVRSSGTRYLAFSALIAALSLSMKLTGAFGLLVPFVMLVQESRKRAALWACGTMALLLLGAGIAWKWSWSEMLVSHFSKNRESLVYAFDGIVLVENWMAVLLAAIGYAIRYAEGRVKPIVPFLAAFGVATIIHFAHHPYWSYYDLHILAPLSVLAGVGAVEIFRKIRNLAGMERPAAYGFVLLMTALFLVQQASAVKDRYVQSVEIGPRSPVVSLLRCVGTTNETAFSFQSYWLVAAGLRSPAEIAILPKKRFWSGQIDETMVVEIIHKNNVAQLIIPQENITKQAWSNLLRGYNPALRHGSEIVFIRNDILTNGINIYQSSSPLKQFGL